MDGRLRLLFDGCLDAADNVDDRAEKPTRPCVRHNLEGVPTDISRSLRAGRGNETPGKRLAPSNLYPIQAPAATERLRGATRNHAIVACAT